MSARSRLLAASVAVPLLLCLPIPVQAATSADEPVSTKGLRPRVRTLTAGVTDLRPRSISLRPRVRAVRLRTRRGDYRVTSDVLFAFDSAKLSPGASDILANVAAGLRKAGARHVTITGYTDSVGSAAYNARLSRRRAAAVRDYLEGEPGRRGVRYTAVGRGESDPVAPNRKRNGEDNPNGRAKNRRVVVSYTR